MKVYRAETAFGTVTGTKREVMSKARLSSVDWERGIQMDRITEVNTQVFTGEQPFPF